MGHRKHLPIGSEPLYDNYYDRFKMDSVIMNANARATNISHVGDYSDTAFLKSLKAAWEGNEEGKHWDGSSGKWKNSRIPSLKSQLAELERRFENYQEKRIREGHSKPTTWPQDLKDKRLEVEARLNIAEEELDYINEHIEKIEAKTQEKDDSMVLRYGPLGSGPLRNSVIVEIDGQNVVVSEEGEPVISDNRSRYNGMLVSDYRKYIAEPWVRERNKMRSEMDEKLRKKEITIEEYRPKIQPPLPVWPKGVKNHLKNTGKKKS